MRRATLIAGLVAAVVAVPAEAKPPKIRQMVVFRDGTAFLKRVSTKSTTVTVHGDRCAVPSRTALAALVRSKPGTLRLRDFGSCSSRPRDAGGLFVRRIRDDRNKGNDGWVYKVGRKAATAGAADSEGPFGTGRRLRKNQRVTWFYCRFEDGSCQRTLALRTKVEEGDILVVRVVGYDDDGQGVDVAGARVTAGTIQGLSGPDGCVRFTLPPGRHKILAEKQGLIRSFTEKVTIP
jgi:hypothetical protein